MIKHLTISTPEQQEQDLAIIADAPYALNGIPLLELDQLHLRDAQSAPLVALLAEIVLSTCTQVAVVPTTHASAA